MKVTKPPGLARRDWEVLCDLSRRLGYPMNYHSPEEIFAEFAALTQSYRGLDYAQLGIQNLCRPVASLHPGALYGSRFRG